MFEDKESPPDQGIAKDKEELSFAEFLRAVLRLRGGNAVKVNDIVELREYMKINWRHQMESYTRRIDTLEQTVIDRLSSCAPAQAPAEPALPLKDNSLDHVAELLREIRAGQKEAAARQDQLEQRLAMHEERATSRHDALHKQVNGITEQLTQLTSLFPEG